MVPGSTIEPGSVIVLPTLLLTPPFYTHNAMNNYQEEEARIALALKHLSTKTSYNLAAVARLFNVDEQKLRRRVAGRGSKTTRPPTNQQLNPAQ